MKLTVVGGGSTYTPELVDGLARLRDELTVDEVVLMDPSEPRLELVGGVSRRILRHLGHPARLTTTTSLRRAVTDADVVLLQLRVGGQATRQDDETVAARVRLRGAGDDRRRRAGQGPTHRSRRARHRRGDPAGQPRRLDRRLHQPGGDRHQGVAAGRAPGDRPVQTSPSASSAGSRLCWG
jgi:hypothetical protein